MSKTPIGFATKHTSELATMRDVFIVDYQAIDGQLTIVLGTHAKPPYEPTAVVTRTATLGATAQAARWRAAGAPLLLTSDDIGCVSLRGSTCVMSELEIVEPPRLRVPSGSDADDRAWSRARTR